MPTYLALRKDMPPFSFAKGKHCHLYLANDKDKKRQEGLNGMSKEAEGARARCPVTPFMAFPIKFIFNSVSGMR